MKKIIIPLSCFIFGIVTLTAIVAQQDMLHLNNKATFIKKQRPPVAFPHMRHMESIECLTCHHDYRNGKNILSEDELEEGNSKITCSNCHARKKINTRPGLRNAFHGQCMGCHDTMKRNDKKTGPRLCGGCHPWKK